MPPKDKGTDLPPPAGELLEHKGRPTEKITGVALGLAIFGFATQVGIPPVVAGGLALVAAFGPLVLTNFVAALRRNERAELDRTEHL